jgi:protein ImuB
MNHSQLWVCLHFPALPLETLTRADPGTAALAIATGSTRPRIVAANLSAHSLGISAGMSVSAALALAPELIVHPRNPCMEAQTLAEIAQWALQFSPLLSLPAADAVLLEVGAGLSLFGGLDALLATIRSGLHALGFTVAVCAAPTPTAALMLARADHAQAVTQIESLEHALGCLPVDTLVCDESVLATLADLGVHRVDGLLQLPRDGLARRFGQTLVDALDRALGRLPDPQKPFIAPERFASRLELPAPVHEAHALLFGAKRLIAALAGWLAGRGLGVMRLRIELEHEDCAPSALVLNLSAPSRDPAHLIALVRARCECIELPQRVEAIALTAAETAALAGHNRSLLPGCAPAAATELCERLAARLGDEAICALAPHPDHRPECAWRSAQHPLKERALMPPAPRPLWLLAEPRPLDEFLHAAAPTPPPLASPQRAGEGPLVLLDGPERIECGWWEGRDVRRDYFVARAASGQTLWVFKHPSRGAGWQVHGIFA